MLGGTSEIKQTWGGACPKRLKTPGLDHLTKHLFYSAGLSLMSFPHNRKYISLTALLNLTLLKDL